ncbi:MAG TPA: Uma2 family endonuclease [Thermoanaerobaculia bacterium]|nr:Uma2 family endonuclease [Thermoanaerobaculia bacterium]
MTQTSTKWTYEDYALLPEDGRRHEIVDGEHYVNPAPNTRHQIVVATLITELRSFASAHGLGQVIGSPIDVVLSANDIVQPDIIFVSKGRRSIITRANIQGAPELVIEVLSDSTRRYDELTKRKLYEKFGVAEYWVVDPELEIVKIGRQEISSGTLTTPLLPGFALDVRRVFAFE